MGASDNTIELRDALEAEEALKLRGFSATCGSTGGVVVDRWNHARGVWHYQFNNFVWTPAGYNEPTYRTATLEGAVAYTLSEISRT